MYRFSNTVIGFLNLLTLLTSIPIIGAGIWMARSSTSCESFLQKPLLIIGFVIMVVSLAGFVGACYDVAWALAAYLLVMLFLIGALMGLIVFGFVVTSRGRGVDVPGKVYKEYHLEKYSPWLRKRISEPKSWMTIRKCILGSKTCDQIVQWTPSDYQTRDMSPVQSGCCKPPTSCNYAAATTTAQDPDCYKWNNNPSMLCYDCDSCKAGVLENAKRIWHKLLILNVAMLLVLICIYSIGCCAFQNTKRSNYGYRPYGLGQMSKQVPRWFSPRWR